MLTRGAYGGVERPLTLENYTRLFDPLYGGDLSAVVLDRGRRRRRCAWCWDFRWRCSLRKSGARKNLYLSLVILPFWTSFLIRTLRLDVSAARHRVDQHAFCRRWE